MTEKTKSGVVALIGKPNVGKSTLMNHLIGQKIAITSRRPQTTRNQIRTVYTEDRGQIVFLDTPGLHKAANRLGEYMVAVVNKTLSEVDVVLWLLEPVSKLSDTEKELAKTLKHQKKPVILVINKVDTIEKMKVPEIMKAMQDALHPECIVPVAALKDVNLSTILDEIFARLPEGPLYYDEETVTEQPVRDIAAEIIREKALRLLQDEIPHGIAIEIEKMRERPDGSLWDIEATIICERESHKGIIIGKNGSMLKKIGTQARADIEEMLEMQVNLKLWVKVRPGWRDDERMLSALGYRKKDLK